MFKVQEFALKGTSSTWPSASSSVLHLEPWSRHWSTDLMPPLGLLTGKMDFSTSSRCCVVARCQHHATLAEPSKQAPSDGYGQLLNTIELHHGVARAVLPGALDESAAVKMRRLLRTRRTVSSANRQ
jgi:hypothetical protein